MNKRINKEPKSVETIWNEAPPDAYHWERFPNGKCAWHCHNNSGSLTLKAPDFATDSTSLWRDPDKQIEADSINADIQKNLNKLNIVLVR